MIITNARIGGFSKNIRIENNIIVDIFDSNDEDGLNANNNRVIPGLIDIHSHGFMGMDTLDADFEKMCEYLGKTGTTSWLPTTMTTDIASLRKVTETPTHFEGSQILGFHLEGPYISKKYMGAQNAAFIKNPDLEEFKTINNVKMITIAPELDKSLDFIDNCGCIVSIGHTDCDYETVLTAIEHGANCLTHIYNAMPPFHHRNPGPVGAAFMKNIYAQIICDGFHISQPVFLANYKMFGSDRLILISDSIRPAGLSDGVYESGGLEINLKNGVARLNDGTIAGSTSTLWQCVKKAVEFGVDFESAVKMATETPANILGIKKGKIDVGYDADLLIIDDDLNITDVIIAGKKYI